VLTLSARSSLLLVVVKLHYYGPRDINSVHTAGPFGIESKLALDTQQTPEHFGFIRPNQFRQLFYSALVVVMWNCA